MLQVLLEHSVNYVDCKSSCFNINNESAFRVRCLSFLILNQGESILKICKCFDKGVILTLLFKTRKKNPSHLIPTNRTFCKICPPSVNIETSTKFCGHSFKHCTLSLILLRFAVELNGIETGWQLFLRNKVPDISSPLVPPVHKKNNTYNTFSH